MSRLRLAQVTQVPWRFVGSMRATRRRSGPGDHLSLPAATRKSTEAPLAPLLCPPSSPSRGVGSPLPATADAACETVIQPGGMPAVSARVRALSNLARVAFSNHGPRVQFDHQTWSVVTAEIGQFWSHSWHGPPWNKLFTGLSMQNGLTCSYFFPCLGLDSILGCFCTWDLKCCSSIIVVVVVLMWCVIGVSLVRKLSKAVVASICATTFKMINT